MDRRGFLNVTAAAVASAAVPEIAAAATAGTLEPPLADVPWRTFEVITEVEIRPQDVPAKLWLPLALYGDTDYQRALGVRWTGNASTTGIYRDPHYGAPAFFAQWDDRNISPKLQIINRVTTRNRNVTLTRPGALQHVSREELDVYLQPTSPFRSTASFGRPRAGFCQRPVATRSNARERSTNGSSKTLTAIRRSSGAGPATSASCSNPAIWVASAPI